jgi:hypothetical protein
MIESLSNQELNRIAEQAAQGGQYEAARGLVEREMQRRTRIMLATQAVHDAYVVPVDPMDDLGCEGCE